VQENCCKFGNRYGGGKSEKYSPFNNYIIFKLGMEGIGEKSKKYFCFNSYIIFKLGIRE